MKKLSAIILCLPMAFARADTVVVINDINAQHVPLAKEDVADVFLGKGQNIHQFEPYDQQNRPLRERFYSDVSGLSLASVRAYWAKRVFTGRGHPPPMLSREETTDALKSNPQAITYSFGQHKPDDTRVLFSTADDELK